MDVFRKLNALILNARRGISSAFFPPFFVAFYDLFFGIFSALFAAVSSSSTFALFCALNAPGLFLPLCSLQIMFEPSNVEIWFFPVRKFQRGSHRRRVFFNKTFVFQGAVLAQNVAQRKAEE